MAKKKKSSVANENSSNGAKKSSDKYHKKLVIKIALWLIWSILVYSFAIFTGPKLHEAYINWNHYKPFNCFGNNCSDFNLELTGIKKQYIGDWEGIFIISILNHWREQLTAHVRVTIDDSNNKISCSYEDYSCDDLIEHIVPLGKEKTIIQPTLTIKDVSKEESGNQYKLCVLLFDENDPRNNLEECRTFEVYHSG